MPYQKLFNHMHKEHGLLLLESEIQEIIDIVKEPDLEEKIKDPTICACGHQHPLVAEFGACGSCMEKSTTIY